MTTISYFALIFAATLWLSRFLLRYVEPDQFLDYPSERKIHTEAIPRFGGIAFGSAIIVLGWFVMNTNGQFTWYYLGAIGMFLLGAMDDYWTLSWRYKLPAQLLVGVLILTPFWTQQPGVTFFGYLLPVNVMVLGLLFVFWFIGISNSVNLVDGMDGLAGGYVFLSSFFSIIIGWITGNSEFIYFNAIVMGAMAAFLHFNQKPARFFMGDSGSLLLGFHVASLPILFLATNGSSQLNITPFILLSTFLIADTARVFYWRLRTNTHPLEPDQTHLHHLLLQMTQSYKGTLLTIFVYLGIFGGFAILSMFSDLGLVYGIIYLAVLTALIFVRKLTDFGIILTNRIVNRFNWDENHLPGYQSLLRIRFLPVLTIVYYLSVILITMSGLKDVAITPMLFGSILLILLFTFRGSIFPHNSEILLIGIGIVQVFLLNIAYSGVEAASAEGYGAIWVILRFTSLALITIISGMNYIMRSRNLGGYFWKISDLLVLFTLVGLATINSLGIGIPITMAFELGVIYLANKLAVPRILEQISSRSSENKPISHAQTT